MKTFNEWKESHLEDNPKDQSLGHSELMEKFNEYIKNGLKKSDEPKRESQRRQPLKGFDEWNKENQHQPSKGFEQTEGIEHKLDKLYDVMNHIRWIGLGIGGMFAITFVIPQCSG